MRPGGSHGVVVPSELRGWIMICRDFSVEKIILVIISHQLNVFQELLMTTLAPSFPSTPLSRAFGLRSRPFLRDKNPNMPDGLLDSLSSPLDIAPELFAFEPSSVQLPVSCKICWVPPPALVFRVTPLRRLFELGCVRGSAFSTRELASLR